MTRHEKILGVAIFSIVMLAFLLLPLLSRAEPLPQVNVQSYRQRIVLSATGEDGAATGSAISSYLRGYVRAIHVDYGDSVTSTTDLTITTLSPAATVFAKTDSATDAWYYPAVQLTGSDGAATSPRAYGRFPVDDYLSISAGQSTSGTVAIITIEYGD